MFHESIQDEWIHSQVSQVSQLDVYKVGAEYDYDELLLLLMLLFLSVASDAAYVRIQNIKIKIATVSP